MNILVLNGSPKGERDVTLQHALYLQNKFSAHTFKIEHVAQRIKRLERDERGATGAFAGRAAAVVTTSIHFYDHLAHDYLAGACEDWGMRFYGAHSAEMWDLLGTEGRAQFHRFAEDLFAAVAQAALTPASYAAVIPHALTYTPGPTRAAADLPLLTAGAGRALRPLITADGLDRSPNLARMVARVAAGFDRPAEVVDLVAVDIKSGCLGCLQCGLDNDRGLPELGRGARQCLGTGASVDLLVAGQGGVDLGLGDGHLGRIDLVQRPLMLGLRLLKLILCLLEPRPGDGDCLLLRAGLSLREQCLADHQGVLRLLQTLHILHNRADFVEQVKQLGVMPDIFLFDIQMDPYDGFDLLTMIRNNPQFSSSKVVALTASVMSEEVARLKKSGFDGAIAKPLNIEVFPDLIAKIMKGESVWYIV